MAVPIISAALAGLMLALVLGWRVWSLLSPPASSLDRPALFFLIIFLAMLVLRLPQIKWYHEISPDESQMLVQGARFLSHPVPWRDVDGTTSGPLNSMLLSVPMRFGAPYSWATARTVLWAANCLTLVFLYLGLRSFGGPAEAQFALIPTILFYAFASDQDSTNYTSEALPVLLLSAGFFLLARERNATVYSGLTMFFLGLLAGAMPFAKLQSAPLALFVLAVGVAALVLRNRRAETKKWRPVLLLCLGVVLAPGLILGVVAMKGSLGDFWKSYILAASVYVRAPGSSRLGNAVMLFWKRTDVQFFIPSAVAALIIMLALSRSLKGKIESRLAWPLLVVMAEIMVTLFCVLVPGMVITHYLLFFVPALAVFMGLVFFAGKSMLASVRETEAKRWFNRWVLLFTVLVAGFSFCKAPFYFHRLGIIEELQPQATMSQVGRAVLIVRRPGDTMSVWGWMPGYYVETQMIPATRDAIGHYVITPGPYREYFQHRYLNDLERSRPAVFLDAVVPGACDWGWTDAEKHEGFPELAGFIDKNYALWKKIPVVENGRTVRIYLLKERFAELAPHD